MKTTAKLLREGAEAAVYAANDYAERANHEATRRDYETPSEDEIAFNLAFTRYTRLADELNAAADAILTADLLPSPLPIARELLQRERESLARDHFSTDVFTCKGCERLAAIIEELRVIG